MVDEPTKMDLSIFVELKYKLKVIEVAEKTNSSIKRVIIELMKELYENPELQKKIEQRILQEKEE